MPAKEPFFFDLTTCDRASLPIIEPDAIVHVDPQQAGAWTVAGDLDGDGVAELVQVRLWESNDTHAIASVFACRLDGKEMWRWGQPSEGVAALHSDAPCQVHDWDRDGRQEVVIVTRTHVIALDGATGVEKWRFATPGPDAADCIVFARLSGGACDDILIKTRYHRIWAYTRTGELLWHAQDPGGMRTSHQPFVLDIDGDGRDEVIAGYALLDHDGHLVWKLDASLGLGGGHLDCVRVLRRGPSPQDWRLVMTCCADFVLLCIDGNGRAVWQHRGLHFESICVGRLGSGQGEQFVVDIDHAPKGDSPIHAYDFEGVKLGEFNTVYSRQHPLVAWGESGIDRVVACEDRLLVDGLSGRPLARLNTPLPPNVQFEQTERCGEHKERGDFHLLGFKGNIFGDGREDLLLTANPGGVVWLYHSPRPAAAKLPLGTGRNVTLY